MTIAHEIVDLVLNTSVFLLLCLIVDLIHGYDSFKTVHHVVSCCPMFDVGKNCITSNAIAIITPTKNAQVNELIHGKIQLLQNLKIRGGKE